MASVLADAETIRKNNTRSLDTKTHSKQEAGAQQYIYHNPYAIGGKYKVDLEHGGGNHSLAHGGGGDGREK